MKVPRHHHRDLDSQNRKRKLTLCPCHPSRLNRLIRTCQAEIELVFRLIVTLKDDQNKAHKPLILFLVRSAWTGHPACTG